MNAKAKSSSSRHFDARPNAQPEGAKPLQWSFRGVRVENGRLLLQHSFLTVEEMTFLYVGPDGVWRAPVTRVNVDRGDSVAALVYEPAKKLLHFTRQFRYPTYDFANEYARGNGWLLELIAGRLKDDSGVEEAPERAMKREICEEFDCAFAVNSIEQISTFYLTPGASNERLHLFFVTVQGGARRCVDCVEKDDDEDIEIVSMSTAEFLDLVAQGEARDAKMICAAEWLRRNIGRAP